MTSGADKKWARARDARTSAIKEFLLGYKVIKVSYYQPYSSPTSLCSQLNAFEPYFRHRIEHLRSIEVTWQRWRFTLGTIFNILADQLPTFAIFITFLFHTKVFGQSLDPAKAFVATTLINKVKSALQTLPDTMQRLFVSKVAIERLVGFLNQPEIEVEEWETVDQDIVFDDAVIGWPAGGDVNEGDFKLKLDLKLPQNKITLVCGPLGSGKTLFVSRLRFRYPQLSMSSFVPYLARPVWRREG